MTDDADLQPAVAAEFQALAGLLDSGPSARDGSTASRSSG
jgi:hypothetical protein